MWANSDRKALLQPIKRASLKPAPVAPVAEWRPNLRAAYRLRPDSRFLLAFGELDRLAGPLPAAPAAVASAEFLDGKWTIRIGAETAGTLPELPDFPDALAALVARAKLKLPKELRPAPPPEQRGRAFLMPALAKEMPAAEKRAIQDHSYAEAARLFADLAFQTPDRLQLAPILPARALALLAAARAMDPNAKGDAALEEEVLLADAMGYTRHAQDRAARLPPRLAGPRLRDAERRRAPAHRVEPRRLRGSALPGRQALDGSRPDRGLEAGSPDVSAGRDARVRRGRRHARRARDSAPGRGRPRKGHALGAAAAGRDE